MVFQRIGWIVNNGISDNSTAEELAHSSAVFLCYLGGGNYDQEREDPIQLDNYSTKKHALAK